MVLSHFSLVQLLLRLKKMFLRLVQLLLRLKKLLLRLVQLLFRFEKLLLRLVQLLLRLKKLLLRLLFYSSDWKNCSLDCSFDPATGFVNACVGRYVPADYIVFDFVFIVNGFPAKGSRIV